MIMSVRLCLPYDRFLRVVDVKIQEFQQKCSIGTADNKMFYTSLEVFLNAWSHSDIDIASSNSYVI